MKIHALRFAAAGLALVLAGCGGGGGGGDSPTGSGSGATPSGLVPAAPTVGATFYTDAGTLRPLQTGASWNYRGTAAAYTGATPVAYQTTTTQTAVSPGGATENTSNSGNTGADTLTVSVTAGQVVQPQSIDFTGKGTPQVVNFIELRSPVRAGDQYVSLDQHYTDTAIDADGDGKPDALDVAVYSRVVGMETLSLPNLPALRAVRVDTFVASRVTYSSTGLNSPIVAATLQTWYVPGIGIVRQASSQPTASGSDVETTDEQIISWDGISTGLGAMPPVPAMIPANNGVFPGQTLPGGVAQLYAFAFGDHALVLSDQPGTGTTTVASRVDLRGNVLGTTLLQGLRMGSPGVATADASGVIYLEPQGEGAVTQYDLARIDPNGALLGSVRGASLTALGGTHVSSYVTQLKAAVDGATLWVLWGRWYYDPYDGNVPGTELVLRPFALDGTPLAPEVIVDTKDGSNLALAAGGGKVLLSWVQSTPGYAVMFGSMSLGGPLQAQALVSGLSSPDSFVTLLRTSGGGALMWPELFTAGPSAVAAGGVLLDGSLLPIRAGTTPLDEQIVGVPPFYSDDPGPAALGSRIVITSTESRMLLPGDASSQQVDSVNWLDVGTAPLAQTPVNSVRYASQGAKRQAVFADRVLVFGGSIGLTTTVVWLNKGS
jgi:hypothetical protein